MGSIEKDRSLKPEYGQQRKSKAITEQDTMPFMFGGSEIKVASAPIGERINILGELRDPVGFKEAGGNPDVHALVNFGQAFAPLIGRYKGDFWEDRDRLPERGVVVLADHYKDAALLVGRIDSHARRLVADPRLYDDKGFCREYYELAKVGYELIDTLLPNARRGRPLSLVRAGLVTTRLAHGVEPDAEISDEIKVVTKRQHPKVGQNTDLMVTVEWKNPQQVPELKGKTIEVADFVNPASGASTAAVVVAAHFQGITPARLIHRSIIATRQGIPNMRKALEEKGIDSIFYALGASDTMSESYYLTDPYVVGDAGHALRHFQPRQ